MSRCIEVLKEKIQNLDRQAISTAFMTYSLVFSNLADRDEKNRKRWQEEAKILQDFGLAVLEPCLRDTLPPDPPADTLPPVLEYR